MKVTSVAAAAAPRAWSGTRAGVVLGGLVVVSIAVQALLSTTIGVPWVMPDELVYSDIARSLAEGHTPFVRGLEATGYGLVYPLVISPAWVLFDDPGRAYLAAKLLNAVVVSLAALPAYALARRFVSSRGALLVAALTLLLPSLAYSGLLITENAFLPVFLLSVLAMARALERPSVGRELLVVLSVGLGVATRPKAVALLAAYVLAVLAYCALEARGDSLRGLGFVRRLVRYRVSLVLTCGGILAVAAAPVLLLGAYTSSAQRPDFGRVPVQTLLNVAALDLLVGIVPFVAFVLLGLRALRGRETTRAVRELVVLTAAVSATFVLLVSAFPSASLLDGHRVLNERNVFFLAPLFFVALLAWLEGRPSLAGRTTRAVVVGACLLPGILGLWDVSYGAGFQTLSLVPWLLFGGSPWSAIPLVALGALAARLVTGVPANGARTAVLFVVWSFLLVSLVVRPVMHGASERAHDHAFSGSSTWIDDAVGGEPVAVLWREEGSPADHEVRPRIDHRLVWVNEFFNRSVDRVYGLGAPMAYSATLVTTPVELGAGGVVRAVGGGDVTAEYVLAPCQLSVVGSEVAFDTRTGARLYRTDGPLRVTSLTGGCVRR